ncbi:amino acid adenylation domain-containing protein [Candidatus Poribacteria bacterium]
MNDDSQRKDNFSPERRVRSELDSTKGDDSATQEEELLAEALGTQLSYWKEKLTGYTPSLNLPTDRFRPEMPTHQVACESLMLSSSFSESLKALSCQHDATLFITVLAAFQTLLHRYTSQDDLCVGSLTVDNVDTGELTNIPANVLVLRTDMSGNPTFRELLDRVREIAVEAYAHRDLPFERLMEELYSEHDLSRIPLFQVMFSYVNTPEEVLETQSLGIDRFGSISGMAIPDLALDIILKDEGLLCLFGYSTELFGAATIQRMTGHFQTLLEAVVADPDQRISELPVLTEPERYQLLTEWIGSHSDYPQDKCIHQLIEAQAEQVPDDVAVAFQGEQLTYGELNCRANQLAHHLQALGVGPEVLVGILAERSLGMIVGILGILKAGGAYVPLDPAYPKERLAFIIEDTRTPVLITQEKLLKQLPEHKSQVICMDREWGVVSQESDENPVGEVNPNNLAYIMYTSGSTGKPKGIMVTHGNVVGFLFSYQQVTMDSRRRIGTSVSTFSFDNSVEEIFSPLCFGGAVHLISPEDSTNVEYFANYLVEHQITTTYILPDFVPGVAQHLCSMRDRLHLKCVITGLAPKKQHILQNMRDVSDRLRILNAYGPTEVTYGPTAFEFQYATEPDWDVPIGRPLPNYRVYVVDANLQPVPIGVPGELLVGGVGLARGYLNRPELTAEKFIPDPFSEEPGARLYRTGDMVRYLPDGNIDFLGRVDNQVKVRGFRIELGEIEAVLGQHPDIHRTVVLAREDTPGDKRLVAYVVPYQGKTLTINKLRSFLKKKLPAYMVPSFFLLLEALPLAPNGKVDRSSLPAPDRSRPDMEEAYVAPHTNVEKILVQTWSDLLGVEQVGIHDDFFSLGGHSLLATQAISRLRSTFQLDLSLHNIFETPTANGLARVIERDKPGKPSAQHSPIPIVSRDTVIPLSFSQERVWFIQQLEPTNIAYNTQSTITFSGPLDVMVLEQSFREIVRRHEIFRTTFLVVDGRPAQSIHPEWEAKVPLMDLQGLPESEREAEALRLTQKEFQKPFDLTRLPLIRWTLLRLSQKEHMLIHVEHHIVHDGWSFNLLIHEVLELYSAFSVDKPSPLPELPIQFADFAHWQRQWMQGEVTEAQLAYWKKRLADCPAELGLPLDHPRPAMQTFRGAAPRIELPLDLCESLRALSRRESVTLFMTMLTAFAALLHRYSGQDDICIGSAIANRRWPETERLIGMILNNVVLRTDLSGDPTFQELLGRVRKVTLEAYVHQDVPFDKVVEALRPERDQSRNPLFQVMFSFHDSPMPYLELPKLDIDLQEGLSNGSAKFDLNIIVIPRTEQHVGQTSRRGSEGITAIWEYNTDLFDASTIKHMVSHFQVLLEAMVADLDQRISQLPILTEPERHQLLVEWNDTQTEYPEDKCIHQLFEAQVERAPDAVAVVLGDRQLTYRELNVRANQLAHHVIKCGVGPDILVGVCMERSLELVVGLLGILKAGGAYVPLDPSYPKERLSFMLEDSQVSVLLSQAELLDELPEHKIQVICLDSEWEAIERESEENLICEAVPENLAYVMYTSGSTGKPKGTEICHHGVTRLLFGVDYVHLGSSRSILHMAPISFDASTFEMWGALLHGARCVLFRDRIPTAEALGDAIQKYEIDTLWLTASLFSTLIDEAPEILSEVRQLVIGGEALSVYHVRRALSLLPSTQIINGYGPTESTTFTCCYQIPNQLSESINSIPIGRPIGNTKVYLLDSHLQPVPVGVPGELHIGGLGLARGYLNRPELTAEKFVPNPFSDEPGGRLYKTGDLARYLPDGNIEFLGRMDYQVKIRGFRIELGEIESVLSEHPAVREVVVLAREDEPGDKRLAAYIVPSQATSARELRSFLKDKLPNYMIPSTFTMLDALPITVSGKINRRALPKPDRLRTDLAEDYLAPRTPIEQQIADIWAAVLRLERIGIHDSFFELGGHSLLATQVISRLRRAFQVEIPLRVLFEIPTVANLAEFIEFFDPETQSPDIASGNTKVRREKGRL